MKVALPSPLLDYTRGVREVSAHGETLALLLHDLDCQFPGIRFRMIDEQERVRPHIKLFVDGELTRDLQVPLASDSEVIIVAALSGG
jgi:molybdopterin converting factor small subunit